MIGRYGFYEGEGTEYRLDPHGTLQVLDFLLPENERPALLPETRRGQSVVEEIYSKIEQRNKRGLTRPNRLVQAWQRIKQLLLN